MKPTHGNPYDLTHQELEALKALRKANFVAQETYKYMDFIAPSTAKSHVDNARAKLKVPTSAAAYVVAKEEGILDHCNCGRCEDQRRLSKLTKHTQGIY